MCAPAATPRSGTSSGKARVIAPCIRWLFGASLLAACAGCAAPEAPKQAPVSKPVAAQAPVPQIAAPAPQASPPAPPASVAAPNKAQEQLAQGIQSYEDGAYKAAARELRAALDLGLEPAQDRAAAHKYLAFIVCVSGREKACREQFGRALDADPAFELEPAEAGNPIWRAALRRVRAERAAKARTK
ncbi:MAG TPA: TssQ family T6SS-associated lipoprotein [Casimicrobiaceae bacterium]|nr:TssQ family T6SS-associated lipoprotein [Casimicrobiaceae bacterium]